jgi:hypothetical protein
MIKTSNLCKDILKDLIITWCMIIIFSFLYLLVEAIICVSLGGIKDKDKKGFYCTGNGVGSDESIGSDIDSTEIENLGGDTTPKRVQLAGTG